MTSFHGDEQPHSKPLFLLDEPASNLHSSAQAELLKSFENMSDHCSLIYATHSHHLINVRWLDSAYVVKNVALDSFDLPDYLNTRMSIHTSISAVKYKRFLAQSPNQTAYIQPVLDVLGYQPSALEPVPNVVLVEGKSDFYLIRYVLEILGVDANLRTTPGTGAGTLDCLIQLHIAWGKSFIILLDGDKEGVKQKARYLENFGAIVKDKCILLPDACKDKSVQEIEDLLNDTDKETIISAIFPAKSGRPSPKKAISEAVMELYARKKLVTLDQATLTRFQLLVELLDENLNGLAK
jgi:predicted ATP-dependent endonuclease of OLD family